MTSAERHALKALQEIREDQERIARGEPALHSGATDSASHYAYTSGRLRGLVEWMLRERGIEADPAPEWRSEPPTEPGYYWAHVRGHKPDLVLVTGDLELFWVCEPLDQIVDLKSYEFNWLGPIAPPAAPEMKS